MNLTPFAVPPLIAALLNFSLTYWVYLQAPKGEVKQSFLWWSTWVGLWNIMIAGGYMLSDFSRAYLWYKVLSAFVVMFLTPLFLSFIVALTDSPGHRANRWFLRLTYAFSVLCAVLVMETSWIMGSLRHYYWGFYPTAGKMEWIFSGTFFLMVTYAMSLIFGALKRSEGNARNQLKFLLAGAIVGFGSGVTNFLPLYGVEIYPWGNVMNSVYALFVAYAIVEYGLIDFRLVLQRGTVYTLVSGALTVVYFSWVAILKEILQLHGIQESYVFYMAAVPLTVFVSPTVKERIEPMLERVPFWRSYHIPDILSDFIPSVFASLNSPELAKRVAEKICAPVSADSAAVYLLTANADAFALDGGVGAVEPSSLLPEHVIVDYSRREKGVVDKEKELWKLHNEKTGPESLGDALESWPYTLTFPLFSAGQLFGLIALGRKKRGDIYNRQDIQLLRMLADQAAVAFSYRRTLQRSEKQKRQIESQKELTYMGILATEMAHELNKPLTHIMNAGSSLGRAVQGPSRKNIRTIENEVQRASEILDGFSMLSPERKLQRIAVLLPDLMEEAIAVLGLHEDPQIRISRFFDALPPIFVNPGQIVQVLTNLIQNAIQAMPEGGQLSLYLRGHLDHDDLKGVEMVVEDTGKGIPSDLQEKVFDPYFTTRKTVGGRGMGLAISRAMVERHGGEIVIQSPISAEGGTRVTIRIPIPIQEKPNEK